MEIVNCIDFIVGDDHLALDGGGADGTQVKREGEHGRFVADGAGRFCFFAGGKIAALDEGVERGLTCADGRGGLRAVGRGIGVTPIDATIIASRAQDRLRHSADTQGGQVAGLLG